MQKWKGIQWTKSDVRGVTVRSARGRTVGRHPPTSASHTVGVAADPPARRLDHPRTSQPRVLAGPRNPFALLAKRPRRFDTTGLGLRSARFPDGGGSGDARRLLVRHHAEPVRSFETTAWPNSYFADVNCSANPWEGRRQLSAQELRVPCVLSHGNPPLGDPTVPFRHRGPPFFISSASGPRRRTDGAYAPIWCLVTNEPEAAGPAQGSRSLRVGGTARCSMPWVGS